MPAAMQTIDLFGDIFASKVAIALTANSAGLIENGAMVEVFYEQLNFEMLTESEAYGFVNLLADFGGQLGLWCGISFLTCCEFVFLFLEMTYMSAEYNWALYKKKRAEKEKMKKFLL
ncbi:hypothetical protein TELCIR_18697 [Teladorsagia circumcincta]|uniref:Uncharacterized protein n=1 Tax=Teladorsagia circumcincta TaxID=45464 RepID=A0A2G9TPK9_TELCI|nr:hypothetical protein TELCIR_18697 [Teladorsagia circumcincta]